MHIEIYPIKYLGYFLYILLFLTSATPGFGRDQGQWEGTDPEIKQWYQHLMRPDAPGSSCCGEADAYWCDNIKVIDNPAYVDASPEYKHIFKHKAVTCSITDDRPDIPLKRPHVDIGTVIVIPDDKMKWGEKDPQPRINLNPTGHAIVFLSPNSSWGQPVQPAVLCFVPGTGT